MPCVNKDCQFGFVDREEEQRGLEESITYYEIEDGEDATFSPLSAQGSNMVPAPGFWVARSNPGPIGSGKQNINSSEEEIEEQSDGGDYHGDFIYTSETGFDNASLYSTTESTQNLSLQDDSRVLPSQDDVVSYKYSEQVTSVISTSSCVNAAPATVMSSNSAVVIPSTTTSSVLPQTAVQPMIVSPPPATGRPAPPGPNEMGDCTVPLPPPPPPYSCDPTGSDLPRDTKVLQYYFNLGLQCYHQSFWHSMVYVQQVPPQAHIEPYQSFPESVSIIDQSVSPLYSENRSMPMETGGNEGEAFMI
ncbi:bifunctional UDP-N-acetylglucosamine transferase and deubiquitinase ALG13 [Pelobates cultripes]|uniref:Bifunctional UDP-N-acetylglucosamine transferase and deubiquitinase ALG13 n=1 Tax=Pelobates cultripes TaxID=61616 RepID=A0AAD1WKS3_PELCU|nr:bifunctional UDP-N-acetylglucosamine transferase and deubiquitinase ALG13 [Pelobates cultripes]